MQLLQLTGYSPKDNIGRRNASHIKPSGEGILKKLTCCRNGENDPACETKCRPYDGKYRRWALKIDYISKILFPILYAVFLALYLSSTFNFLGVLL